MHVLCKLSPDGAEVFFFSTRLFQLLGAETHVSVKAGATCAFGSAQNANFWKKLRFGPRLKMH